ncbi:T7SS effector LXG polymorphic toxin [Peribacillus frigoritolerans]|uniref:T7SS effector LXG polymorphic toxin n=1 Tax=Peribacillus frigoritolerans TaxID=450367 RepID=UPI002B256054|nr:T7SS effector LXG polymorphic toxin [Peribacillus frigoritolerans]MEB2493889.1 T7SS effector LXG polymorphic toxin [Peribacillus frigoritolerans]
MSMIYESQTLVSAMQTRVGQYKDLKEQLTELKKGFESIVHLDDELQGQGAEAIKGFYKAQIDVVDSWLRLINRHVAFLSGIQGDTIEANLSETVVTVPFLEEELTNATRNSKEVVTAQKNDLKKILAGIDDIIQLEPFSDDAFFENIEKAETKRTETIDKVNEIDHKWTTEYAKSEADQAAVTALMEQLKVSSTRGGVVSPLYFNAAAYKNSEAYKNLEVRKKETAQYLKVKKEEAENRRIKDLKAQLDHVTNPDEFLKIAKQIGYENLAPTQQQYVMQLEAAKQTADIAKGIGVGLYDVGKDFVTGVWDFVTDPGETVEGVANSIMHPIQTYKYISKSISDSYERDMVNGDAYSRSHWVTYALGTVVTSVVGTKGAGAVAKTGIATTKAAAVKGATKAKELATIPNLLPYNPKNQLSLAGGVPYNVVNGAGLKEQLITMAKVESEVSGRGTGNSNRLIPGNPGVITGGNSNKLGKNMMEDMGLKRSTKWSGYQAQHIIPSEMAKNPVIQKIGMNFDDSSNGIFLRVPDNDISTMSRHRGYHSVYNEVVERALNKMDINQSVNSLQKDVYELKNNLRKLQENGLPLYPSQGATVELWERKLKQLEK